MTAQVTVTDRLLRQPVLGSRRLSNLFWAVVITLGGVGFLLAGISSYLNVNLLLFSDATQLVFIPQGIVMGFYGVAAILLATYLWLLMLWDIGGGYNAFDREAQKITIFRNGYPGKNRRVELSYGLDEAQSVKVEIREGLNPKRALYLKVRQRGDIPLTRVGQPIALTELENQGAELARFLGVPLEGL